MVSYQYMSSSCYREIQLLRFIKQFCTSIYNKYVNLLCFIFPPSQHSKYITKKSSQNFSHHTNFESIPFVIFSKEIFCCRHLIYYLFKIFDCQDVANKKRRSPGSNIEIQRSIGGRLIMQDINTNFMVCFDFLKIL